MTSNEGIESVTTGNNVSRNVSRYRTILFIYRKACAVWSSKLKGMGNDKISANLFVLTNLWKNKLKPRMLLPWSKTAKINKNVR